MTKEEYSARYKKPVAGFKHLVIERNKNSFFKNWLFWVLLVLAMAAVYFLLLLLPAMSFSWGFAGLLTRILFGLLIAACLCWRAVSGREKFKRLWSFILAVVICAAIAAVQFIFIAGPPIRDLGEKPVTGTFRVVTFETRRRSLTDDMVAYDVNSGQRVSFPVLGFSRDSRALREKLKAAEKPIAIITYYPHSKVRRHMEY